MLRARLAIVALATGLGLSCGCSTIANHPWFSRLGRTNCDGCETGSVALGEGPILEGPAPVVISPGPQNPGMQAPVTPIPQLTAPPRLVPEPQAQPVPAVPSRRTPRVFQD